MTPPTNNANVIAFLTEELNELISSPYSSSTTDIPFSATLPAPYPI